MGGVLSGIGSIFGPILNNLTSTPQGSTTSPLGSLASGLLTAPSYRPQGQQYPGAFYPQPGQGGAYNYIPTGQPAVDAMQQQMLAYQSGAGLTAQELADPMLATLLRNQMNDPRMAGVMPAANQAAQMMGQIAPQAYGAGQQLQNQQLAALPQYQNILAMGTDPQGALYQRTLQQLKDQMGGQMAQTGLTGTGAGMGIQQQGLENFNIDWQNQQLNRALSAMQGYGGAMGQAGQVLQGATGLEQAGAQAALEAGQIPFKASQAVMGQQGQDLANYLAAMQGAQGIGTANLGSMLNYMQSGLSANQIANEIARGTAQQAGQQQAAAAGTLAPLLSTGISGIGQGLGALYNQFFGGSSDPLAGLSSTDPTASAFSGNLLSYPDVGAGSWGGVPTY
jgi:hypothetical protein